MNDTLDEMLTESGDEEESDMIVNKVLDEIGIEMSGKMATAPAAIRGNLGESSRRALPTDEEIEEQLSKLRSWDFCNEGGNGGFYLPLCYLKCIYWTFDNFKMNELLGLPCKSIKGSFSIYLNLCLFREAVA